jgi:predicted DNA-binding protein (MmcQ/YjbR family)
MPPGPLARLRKICLALPGAHEVKAWETSTFRVKKIFAMYAQPSDSKHSGGRPGVWLKAGPGNAELMIRDRPTRFYRPPYVGTAGWVGVWLDKRPPWKEIAELVEDSWRLIGGKR